MPMIWSDELLVQEEKPGAEAPRVWHERSSMRALDR
jgi:hypothetical protein